MSTSTPKKPANPSEKPLTPEKRGIVRAAVFESLPAAERAVNSLRESGFSVEEISVVCSDVVKERYFKEYEHQQPAGTSAPAAAAVGGAVGATLFGLSVVTLGAVTGMVPLIVAGGWGIWTGAVAGGFVGAMMTRGVEKELANFYDQAVVAGKILVAVELHGEEINSRLKLAETLLAVGGSEPVALPEG